MVLTDSKEWRKLSEWLCGRTDFKEEKINFSRLEESLSRINNNRRRGDASIVGRISGLDSGIRQSKKEIRIDNYLEFVSGFEPKKDYTITHEEYSGKNDTKHYFIGEGTDFFMELEFLVEKRKQEQNAENYVFAHSNI